MTGWVIGSNGTILNTMDGGFTWVTQPTGTLQKIQAIEFIDAQTGWAVADGGVVLHSINSGATWQAENSGTSNDLNDLDFVATGAAWAVGNVGIIVHRRVATGVADRQPTVPNNVVLEQNYPNPFNPSTLITYRIAEAGHVSLNVYNLIGEEVTTLVNERQVAGEYTLNFDARNLPSGHYMYKLSVNDGFLT
jgi:photosystem II stability/assembly factor-like uncharacterized protein